MNYPVVLPNGERVDVYYEADGKGEGDVTVTFHNPKWRPIGFRRDKLDRLRITVVKANAK